MTEYILLQFIFFGSMTGTIIGFVLGPPVRDWFYKWRFERRRRREVRIEQVVYRILKTMMNDGYESFDDMVYDHYAHGYLDNIQYEAICLALKDNNLNEAYRLFEKYHNNNG